MTKVVVQVTGLNRIPCWVKSMIAQKVCLRCQRQVINLKCMVKEKTKSHEATVKLVING